MIKKSWFILVAGLILAVFSGPLQGQDRILLKKADEVAGQTIDGQNATLVIGSVHFFVPERNLDIYCDTTFIFSETSTYILSGNVQLIDTVRVLHSDKVHYNMVTEIAFSPGPFLYTEPVTNRILTADSGKYYYKDRVLVAEKNVRYREGFRELRANKMDYREVAQEVRAEGDVLFYDLVRNVTATSQYGEYFQNEGYGKFTGGPLIVQPSIIGTDTMYISGKTMEYFGGNESRFVVTDSVSIIRCSVEGLSNKATYEFDQSKVVLEDNPMILHESTEIYGSQIDLLLQNNVLKEVVVIDSAVAYTVADTSGRYSIKNELHGKIINIFLKDERIERIVAIQNAESIYYSFENNELQGKNVSSSGQITILLENGQLNEIKSVNRVIGEFTPASMLPEISNRKRDE